MNTIFYNIHVTDVSRLGTNKRAAAGVTVVSTFPYLVNLTFINVTDVSFFPSSLFPVLLLRRLILLTASIFIVDPILKLYPVGVLLVLFGFHDYIVRPFTDHNLNVFQIVSYGLLIVLTTQNSTHFGHSQTI